jgi:phosphate transport system substrate-binding protein
MPGFGVPFWMIIAGVVVALIIITSIIGAVVRSRRPGRQPAAKLSGLQWLGVIVVAALVSAGVALAALALVPMEPSYPMPPDLEPWTPEPDPWAEPRPTVPSMPDEPSGNLSGVGSDTLLQLVTFWIENLRRIHPNLRVTYTGKGSSTATPALIQGTSEFGPMSRAMKPVELESFVNDRGYEPTELIVAIDALTVYVNKDNPIKALSFTELQGLFGSDGESYQTWGEVFRSAGQEVPHGWDDRRVSVYGRNSASGTYSFFKRTALQGADFRREVKEMPGSPAVIEGVGSELDAIGYSGAGFGTSQTREIPIGETIDSAVPPTKVHALDGSYPLARPLYIYIDKGPDGISVNLRAFLEHAYSRDGQAAATKIGFFALPEPVRLEQLAKLD